MSAFTSDGTIWIDGLSSSPPNSYEGDDVPGTWYFQDGLSGLNSTITLEVPVADLLATMDGETTLTIDWELALPTDHADPRFFYDIGAGSVFTELTGTSGTVTIPLASATSLQWGVDFRDSDEPPYNPYTGAVRFTEQVAAVVEPETGLVYGTVINLVEKDVLDSFYSAWTRPSTKVPGTDLNYYKSYAMDGNDPLAFWLWPRGYADANVIITYVAIPEAPVTLSETLTLSDMYIPDMVDYLCYRALSKDARAGAKVIAQQFRESFLLRLGANRQIMKQIGQNATRPPDAEA